jgi:hypothetical protein
MALSKTPKSYSDYSLNDLRTICGIDNRKQNLSLLNDKKEPSTLLLQILEQNKVLPINSEKARSELLITPVLVEWLSQNPHQLQYFSGNTKHFSMDIVAPVVAMFEAKDDNVDNWYGQCGAEMYSARLFNERNNEPYKTIYGAVTDGFEWVFLKLEDEVLLIDTERYYLRTLSELLGALQTIMDFYSDKP